MQTEILGIKVNNLTENEVVELIGKKIEQGEKFWVATPNPEMVVYAQNNPTFASTLNLADLAVPDGKGLVWAGKILGQSLPERVTGTDLMGSLCQEAASCGWKVCLLGGRGRAGTEALTRLQEQYPGLLGMAMEGPRWLRLEEGKLEMEEGEENEETIREINKLQPQILFVGFGMEKQECWLMENLPHLKVNCALVVGGAFDFYSGTVKRAPLWVRNLGFEWLWRLVLEPWRWRRQLSLVRFVWLVLLARLNLRREPIEIF